MKDKLLSFLSDDVPAAIRRFDSGTGRFLIRGGWAVTNQDIVYPLALLHTTKSDANPYYHNDKILALAVQGADAWRNFQNEDGSVEFVKVDGSTWGPIYMPWSMYHWLETYALLESIVSDETRTQWEDGLLLAFSGIHSELVESRVHNIPAWNAMALYRAGGLLGKSDWIKTAREHIAKVVDAQEPEGYWKEHGGPTPFYNQVYVHALGLYFFASSDDSVMDAIQRATDFHIMYSYPDGSPVETIDGRVKYHRGVPDYAYSAYSLTPLGRKFLETLVDQETADRLEGKEVATGPSPRLASAFQHLADGPTSALDTEGTRYRVGHPRIGVQRRNGPWVYCLSSVTTPTVAERWGQDRQSFVSVWKQDAGLIAGGGNSKEQPDWSTFSVDADGERIYVPTSANLEDDHIAAILHLSYGRHICSLKASFTDEGGVLLVYSEDSKSDVTVTGRLQLCVSSGDMLSIGDGEDHVLSEDEIHLKGSQFAFGGCLIEAPAGAQLTWPVYPFNPYAADGTASIDSAVAILSFQVNGTTQITLRD